MEASEKTPLLKSGGTNSVDSDAARYDDLESLDPARQSRTLTRSSGIETLLPTTLSWSDVRASAILPVGKKGCCKGGSVHYEKEILKGITGNVEPGSLLAIMGASGAGKTTLLNVLTHRNTKAFKVTGDFRINGWPVSEKIKNVSAYVQQDDLFISTLTVREQLQFRALLRMDKRLNKEQRLTRVEEVILEMGLTGVANSRIGTAGGSAKGLSGGERKRLSFASEALTNPPIFFCDEPTSGLDTFMAQNIVTTLKGMAARGRAVLCTIHQPSSELFAMFNKLLLLSEGRVSFMGSRQETIEHFESLGYPCPVNFNPADHFILTLAVVPGREEACRKRAKDICDAFHDSSFANEIIEKNNDLVRSTRYSQCDQVLKDATMDETRYRTSWLTQFRYLFWRAWISQFRDIVLFRVRVMQAITSAIVLGLIYFQMDITQKGVMDINGAIFVIIVNTTFSNLFAIVNTFPIEMEIFLREYGTQLYRTDVYYISKSLCEFPIFLMISAVFGTIVYWMMGLYDAFSSYLIAVGVILLTANTALAFGYCISTLAGSVTVSLAIAPPILIPFMLFGGFFLNSDNTPIYFVWLKYISWFKYATEIMMANQWTHIDHIPCDNGTMPVNNTLGKPDFNPNCLFRSGNDVLRYTSFSKDNNDMIKDALLLVLLIAVFRVVSFIALLVRAKRSKE